MRFPWRGGAQGGEKKVLQISEFKTIAVEEWNIKAASSDCIYIRVGTTVI